MACHYSHAAVVEELLTNDDLDTNLCLSNCCSRQSFSGASPLMLVARNGNHEILQKLLAAGAEIDAVTNKYESSLYYASKAGHAFVVDILLSKGADVNLETTDSVSPLMAAAFEGHKRIVRKLLLMRARVPTYELTKPGAKMSLADIWKMKREIEAIEDTDDEEFPVCAPLCSCKWCEGPSSSDDDDDDDDDDDC